MKKRDLVQAVREALSEIARRQKEAENSFQAARSQCYEKEARAEGFLDGLDAASECLQTVKLLVEPGKGGAR